MKKQINFIQNPHKKEKRTYWIITVITMALIILPSYFAPKEYLIETIKKLQFPDYFPLELDILKIVGALVILVPAIPTMFKEWAYVGFGILLLSASLAHGMVDGLAKGVARLFRLHCLPYPIIISVN
ncbi:DoxX family protein [Chryseobacterium profundimaris]|uniref:DoxX-like family protein n=1 Tax=Chryseobacterium profundimaris TaxID=1387275 RepID=A0ABY1PGN9_9FLAO|nr:DoxX family protein [Chryseobacterium profundimaris]SMP33724.1 DoxX-like family protein [Chryseobacterium profundimaris]